MTLFRPSVFADAVPIGRGHRTPQTMLLIDERDTLLREAAASSIPVSLTARPHDNCTPR